MFSTSFRGRTRFNCAELEKGHCIRTLWFTVSTKQRQRERERERKTFEVRVAIEGDGEMVRFLSVDEFDS